MDKNTNVMKQFEVLQWASLFLEENKCETGVAEILLQHHLNVSRSQFYMTMQEEIPAMVMMRFIAHINKHIKTGVPVQHLTGYEFFYGRKFEVNEHTLIPRPETEELVQHVIELSKTYNEKLTIVDIGTGSGVIATTLALEIPDAKLFATDISDEALLMASKNATTHQAEITFLQGDLLEPVIESGIQPNIIVSNPPYIAMKDKASLSRTVKYFDPEVALFADDDGLAAYKEIIVSIPKLAKQPKIICFEIGYEQGKAVSELIKSTFPTSSVTVLQDINGKDRIVSANLPHVSHVVG